MYSVTRRIRSITQPRGGYLPPRHWEETQLGHEQELHVEESIHPTTMGMVVDYLTRHHLGAAKEDAFSISLMGAETAGEEAKALELLSDVRGLDDASIQAACRLTGYDVCLRAGIRAFFGVDQIEVDGETAENVRQMVKRSLSFFDQYGPVTADQLVFPGGYTPIVSSGDGDFLTADTLWDFKVSKYGPTKDHTLQLLMYYLMGLRSIHKEAYEQLTHLGVYNPRLNRVYRFPVADISQEVKETVEQDVIGYLI